MAQAKTTATTTETKPADEVSAQIAALKADIASLTSAVADLGRAKSAEFQDYAKAKAAEAKAKAQEGADYMKANAEFAYGRANDFVVERPATAIGIAAAVGFLIGHFSSRK
ncbi:DUF883 family protein [Vannielia litorea]|uniref:Membrane-anchored ribosome-binding protein, inhibits growth in stationary phase, ElaB/YqjD/DUF883 family n=1 Tax=Vannielia litorea TaxID=1217970 RepID=A0A1N6EWL8_9RHOB|nr:DUF883 family protein [Vannielia litorea]SIN87386.1 Membrane-anchored ribosome-binding protein, inhibits growth in stationary phase, ElaB/YqjD/DUF883 family [Vannielia litorea]